MINRRSEERLQTLYHARVYNIRTNELVGYLVDVSHHGVRLMALRPIEPGENLTLQFHCPVEINGLQTIIFKAQVQWCKRDHNLDFWAVGTYVMENAEQLYSLFYALEDRLCRHG